MGIQKVFSCVLAVTIIGSGLSGARVPSLPKEVIRHPQPEGKALAARFDWALAEAAKKGFKDGFWVGYSIRRLMGERSWIGSFYCDRREKDISLQEIISGQKSEYPLLSNESRVKEAAREELEGIEKSGAYKEGKPGKAGPGDDEKKVWKEVALLLEYSPLEAGAAKTPERGAEARKRGALTDVGLSNMALSFDFKGLPLFWIGGSSDEESLGLIRGLFARATAHEAKEGLVAAAGMHGTPALALPFLKDVLAGDEPDDIRKDASFWIGQQDDEQVLKILSHAARADRSQEVRKSAVFSISQVKRPAAIEVLINLAKGADSGFVRKEAVFWLGQAASKKAVAALEGFAYDEADTRIQEAALFALSELPGREGLAPLIKIAKTHPNPHIRKRAVFWLSESDDPRVLTALIEIAKGK